MRKTENLATFTDDGGIRSSEVYADVSVLPGAADGLSRGSTLVLQDGIELMYWSGCFEQPLVFEMMDDRDRVYFSFNSLMDGGAACSFSDGAPKQYEVQNNSGNIQFGPGRHGIYRQTGSLQNLTIMIRPDVLSPWIEDADRDLRDVAEHGGFLDGHRGGELLASVLQLSRALDPLHQESLNISKRHPLWLHAQSMAIVGLFLESRGTEDHPHVSAADRQKIMQARNFLLADLTQAPKLAQIAREVGLSAPTLTRGFRRVFKTSPYELFQRERMHQARHLLLSGAMSVSTVAAELGYTNASHFAAAFRKQFSQSPRELMRS